MNRRHPAVVMILALALGALWGCSTPTPPAATTVPDAQPRGSVPGQFQIQPGAAAPSDASARPSATTSSRASGTPLPEHLDPASPINRERSVYFAFDDSNVAPEHMPLVERHAKYLAANASVAVRIEGHSDERGGPEYNLALGQRRAEAVARALRLFGVTGSRVEAVSYGEERPQAFGHTETAWTQNRRADIGYPRR